MPRKKKEMFPINKSIKYGDENLIQKKFLGKSDRFMYFKKQKKIKKWLDSNSVYFKDFDIIHAHTLFSDGYWAYKSGKPYIITVRNTDLNYFIKYFKHLKPIGKNILENASKIVFLSKVYEIRTIKELFEDEEEIIRIQNKSVVIPNGINDFWINNALIREKKNNTNKNIVFTGKILKNKNLKLLTSALKKIDSNYNLFVIGKIEDKAYFHKVHNEFKFTYLGEKNKVEIAEIYKEMDMFILPSFHETFGLVYLEALTQGLPLIYTKNEGIDQYFKEGRVGFAVDPNNVENLIKAIKKIEINYEKIIENINDLDKQKFSWDTNVKCHLQIYNDSLMVR
ncbi:glycosyltransferase family 4 protein [Mammaliicoccus sciuri]|uniref:glycosyltransferase family 4 protein n=1 Tax=Mammaliicoccus sciuri TaxID=1296 RepID=UPI003F56DC96